jgi:alkylhydroperoxidase family enzyme
MQSRISSPALSVPGVLDALQSLSKAANEAANQSGLPHTTLDLVSLRASQINGCAVCLDMHTRGAKKGLS